jgi:hypothetical protein
VTVATSRMPVGGHFEMKVNAREGTEPRQPVGFVGSRTKTLACLRAVESYARC